MSERRSRSSESQDPEQDIKWQHARLFGGAITCDIPANFEDVSKQRPVPDHQEVWLDKDSLTCIIIELTERVGPPGSSPSIDGSALTTHLTDLVNDDEVDSVRVWNTAETTFSSVGMEFPAYTLLATQTPKSAMKADQSQNDPLVLTAIILSLLRLEKESTDILVTISVPHIKGEYDEDDVDMELGKTGTLIGRAVGYAGRVWETLAIKNWRLFNKI